MDNHKIATGTAAPLPLSARLSFGLGDLGAGMLWQCVTLYLMFFSTEVLRIAPAVAGSLVMIALIWDGIIDVAMGRIADRTRSRWGRYRPWLLFASPVMALAFVAMFTRIDGLSPTTTIILALGSQIVFRTTYAMVSIPYGALTSALTADSGERATLTGFRMAFAAIGGLMAGICWMPMVEYFGAGDRGTGFAVTAAIFAVASGLFVWLCFGGTREAAIPLPKADYRLRELPALAKANAPFLIVVTSIMLGSTGGAIMTTFLPYFFKYVVADDSLLGQAILLTVVIHILLMPVWVKLSKHIGKSHVWIAGTAWATVASLLFYFLRPSSYFALMGLFAFAAVAMPANALSTFSVLPDTVEYGEWKTGKRVEAGLFSAMILAQKFAIGLGSWLAGFALSRSGYSPSAGIPAEGVDSFLQVMFLGPAIASILTIAILTRYPITPQLHARLVRAIAWRNRHRDIAP